MELRFEAQTVTESGWECCFICGRPGENCHGMKPDGIHYEGEAQFSLAAIVDGEDSAKHIKNMFDHIRTLPRNPIRTAQNFIHVDSYPGRVKVRFSCCKNHVDYLDELGDATQKAGNLISTEIIRKAFNLR